MSRKKRSKSAIGRGLGIQKTSITRKSSMPISFQEELDRIKKSRNALEVSLKAASAKVNGTSVTCPYHNDKKPSGSIFAGEKDGSWLYTCHGCEWNNGKNTGDVFDVVRKKFGSTAATFDEIYRMAIFHEAFNVIQPLVKKHGKPSPYFYCNIDGVVVMMVVRFDGKDGKTTRPFRRVGNNWEVKRPEPPIPIYRLREITSTPDPVFIVEGEKCVENAREIGLNATTSAGGSGSAKNSDWRPLAGRNVVIFPDNDKAGAKYAEDVTAILQQLDPPASVKVVGLPGLSDKGDIVDYIEKLDTDDPDEIRNHIQQLVDDAQPVVTGNPNNVIQSAELQSAESGYPYPSFPVEVLPELLQRYIKATTDSFHAPEGFAACPLLCLLAAAIGTSRALKIKSDWIEYPALWCLIIGDSGSMKSPVMKHILSPIFDAENVAWSTDITIEALAEKLSKNLRGVIYVGDELSGWINGFNQYKAGGSDEQAYLSLWSCAPWQVTRKTTRDIQVANPCLTIVGGIQPSVLGSLIKPEQIDNGFFARFLFAYPPRKPKKYSEVGVPDELKTEIDELFSKLAEDTEKTVLEFSASGKKAWDAFMRRHIDEENEFKSGDPRQSTWSKLSSYAGRLIIVLHSVRLATGETTEKDVDAQTVENVEQLITYFKIQASRVFKIAVKQKKQTKEERVYNWIKKKRNPGVRARDILNTKIVKTSKEAQQILQNLVDAGKAEWRDRPKGKPRLYLKSAVCNSAVYDQIEEAA